MSEDTKLILDAINELRTDFTEIRSEITELHTDVAKLDTNVTKLQTDVSDLQTDVSELRTLATDTNRRVKALEITYENELRPSVREIAGAHLDLSRKLDVAMQFEKEREIIMLQINYHDSELKRLKVRLDELESCG